MLSIGSLQSFRRFPQLFTTLTNTSFQTLKRNVSQNIQNNQNLLEERLTRIDSFVRKTGRVNRRDVDQVVKELLLLSKKSPPTTTQSLLMIRCCGSLLSEETPQQRNALIQTIFETLSNTTKLDISHYNSLLQVYLDNEYQFNPLDILSEIQAKGIEPNRVTFQRLIHRFCQMGDISGATKILEFMKSKSLPVNETVFNSLILGYGRAGDLQSAYETIDVMKGAGLEPSADTYTSLLQSFASDVKNPKTIERMKELIEESNRNEIFLNDSDLLQVIKSIAMVDNESILIDELINKLNKAFGYNQECVVVVYELINLNQMKVSLKLYETMTPSGQQLENKTTGTQVIKHLVRANASPDLVFELCNKLKEKEWNDNGLSRAVEAALTCDKNTARLYLKKFSEETALKVHYFWPILAKCKDENELFEVLSEDMSSLSDASYESLLQTFAHYVWPKSIPDVDIFMEKCKSVGFSYVLTYNGLIAYYLENNRIKDVAILINSFKYSSTRLQTRLLIQLLSEAFVNNPDIENVIKILKELVKNPARNSFSSESQFTDIFGRFLIQLINRNIDEKVFDELLTNIERSGIKISNQSADYIRKKSQLSNKSETLLSKISVEDITDTPYYDAEDIAKPRREMNTQELEEHLIELRSKGLNTRGVLRSLLLSYCRRTRFTSDDKNDELVKYAQKRVQELINQINESGQLLSDAMFASLMEFYTNCEDSAAAIETRNKITDDFHLDPHKVFHLAALYVKEGFIEKAIDFINEEKARKLKFDANKERDDAEDQKQHNPRYSDRSISRLLNAIIEQKKDPNLVKEVFELCIAYSGLKPTGLSAGPIVKVHVLNEDFSSALQEYTNCATKYRVLPWKGELMRTFLEKSDPTSLQTVIDRSNEIHGEMNTIVELSVACISVGKIKQAKKLIDTPGLRVRPEKLENVCINLIENEKIDDLENFIAMTKHLFDVNRDQLYYYLIKGYAKVKSPEKALNVWTLIQEENIQPSDKTLIFLADFLQNNKIDVPFAVPPKPTPESHTLLTGVSGEVINSGKELLTQLNAALKRGDIDEALNIKRSYESKGSDILMSQNCSLIESLLNSDRISEAYDLTQSLLKQRQLPSLRILRFLLNKLASIGDIKLIQEIKPHLPDSVVGINSFSNNLTNAYVKAGKAEQFVDEVLQQLKPFPLGGILSLLESRPDLEQRILDLAKRMASNDDFHLPLNMVWLHYMINEKYDEADKVFNSCPKLKDQLLFTSLLDKIREKKNVELAKHLIKTVLKSNLTTKTVGIVYSCLIDVLVSLGDINAAEDLVIKDIISNTSKRIDQKTGTEQPVINIESINRTTIKRLVNGIKEKLNREPKFSLPKNGVSSQNTSSDDSSNGNTSSDDEALEVKQK